MKRCEHCGTEFQAKRADAKYCSNSCRQLAHNSRKGLGSQTTTTTPRVPGLLGMRPLGLLGGNLIPNPQYEQLAGELDKLNNQRRQIVERRTAAVVELVELTGGRKLTAAAALLGAAVGAMVAANKERSSLGDLAQMILYGAGVGGAAGYIAEETGLLKPVLRPEVIGQVEVRKRGIEAIDREILALDVAIQAVQAQLAYIPRRTKVKESVPNRAETAPRPALSLESIKTPTLISSAPQGQGNATTAVQIVPSTDLVKRQFKTWPFVGDLAALFGQPEHNALAIIHGPPGAGKSTLCARVAGQLARQYGKVIYASAEEGTKGTMQAKITGHEHQYLDLIAPRSLAELAQFVKAQPYAFVFIDSLQHLGIQPDELETLRKVEPARLFICISQTNKAGNMRGSQEFAHNADIVVKVENGQAQAEKNRYGLTNQVVNLW